MFPSMLLFLYFLICGNNSQEFEGSGEERYIDEYWLQRFLEHVEVPHFLMQKALEVSSNAKDYVDDEEILILDASVPEFTRELYTSEIIDYEGDSQENLKNATGKLMSVVYFAFRAFGCDQDNIWPSVYNLTRENVGCIAFTLLQRIYDKSEFTRKYFARAIHFGMTSTAPVEHRIHEMMVYQFLLPTHDRVWFNNVKIQLKNTFWNEQELLKSANYEDNSFLCGSIPFTDDIQEKIDYYVARR